MSEKHYRLIAWIANAVVAICCILAIAGYFFAPFWSVNVDVEMKAEELKDIVLDLTKDDPTLGDMFGEETDFKELLGTDKIELSLAVELNVSHLFSSLGSDGEETVNALVEHNADSLVDKMTDIMMEIMPSAAKGVAKSVVKDQVNSNVKKYLDSLDDGSDMHIDDVKKKLEDANITDEYIDQKIDQLVDAVFSEEGTNKEEVTDQVMEVVDEVYDKLKNSGDPDFSGIELSEKDKDSIREEVDKALDGIADSDGNISVDELLDRVLSGLLGDDDDDDVALLAAETPAAADSGSDQLKEKLHKVIMEKLNDPTVHTIIVWSVRGLCIFMMLTWIPWVYILIKLIVKLISGGEPTVRLKSPIICGWLPFLILFAVPSIALLFMKDFIVGQVTGMLPAQFAPIAKGIGLSFSTSGWIAFMCACICFAVSILFIVLRKKSRHSDERPKEAHEESDAQSEVAVSDTQSAD